MTPEEIQKLVADTVADTIKTHSKAILDDVTAYVENRTQALEDRLNVSEPSETPPGEPADDALTARLALLEKELNETKAERQRQEDESRKLKFDAEVANSITAHGSVLHPDVVTELLTKRLSDGYTVKDGTFITKSGKTVQEEVKGFMDSKAGKHFLAPTQITNGTGSTVPEQKITRADNARSLANALLRK